ncbi:MAG: 4Fe-4S dicluster domain-containing protein [Nitrososphaerales archaeon]
MRFHIEVLHPERCIGCYSCMYACSRHLFGTVDPSRVAVFVRVNESLANPFTVIACRFCKNPECALACPKGALQPLPEGGITLIASKCEGCETFDCIDACVIRALVLDKKTKFPVPIICDRCGDCAKYCPHNVFEYREMK